MILGTTLIGFGQMPIPKLSPLEKIETMIGMSEVTLTYSRPSMRNREIFGDLVPYDKIWRTGANRNTKIIFSEAVVVGQSPIPAGSYTIFSKPNKESWEFYIHTELNEYGAPDSLFSENIIARYKTVPILLKYPIETFELSFKNHTSNSAVLSLAWEHTRIDIPISVNSDQLIQDKFYQFYVDQASHYESAAWIYYDKEKNYHQALIAINKCIEIMESEIPFERWVADESNLRNPNRPRRYLTKAEILAKLNQKSRAIEAAKKSLDIAYKINSDYYIEKNTTYIKDWQE